MHISGSWQTFIRSGEPARNAAVRLSKVEGASFAGRQRAVTSQFRLLKRNVPTVELTQVSALNAIKVQNVDAVLSKSRRVHPAELSSLLGSRFLSEQRSKFNRIYDVLVRLRLRTGEIQENRTFNIKSVTSSDPDEVVAKTRTDSVNGEYDITVKQIAEFHELGSSVSSNPGRALGYTGTFRINGWTVDVVAGDSLISIRDKINQGEDTNQNGYLDRAEDLNGNGVIDVSRTRAVYTQEGYLPSFYYNEDLNGNGVLDGSEDTNDNEMADGGFSQTGVRAVVAGDQLVLISDEPADVELRFRDPNRILERIGFLVRNNANGAVTTEKLNEQTVQPELAEFSVDGEQFTDNQNEVYDTGSRLVLTLIAVGDSTVNVEDDADRGLAPIVRFSLSYNNVLRLINDTIQSGGALSKNTRLQSIHSDTVRSFYTPPALSEGQFKPLAKIGITSDSSEPTAIKQLAFEQILKRRADRLPIPGPGKFSFFGQSERIGINSSENYVINLDKAKVKSSLERDSASVGEMLEFAASRLQKSLDSHLQPDYGTIRFQRNIIDFYLRNEEIVETALSRTSDITRTNIETGSTTAIFGSFA